ncbi:MAG: HK97 family phage prohead protease [Kiritimatiellia bacterium]
MEFKNIPLKLKDLDTKQGIITGYWSSFGVADAGNDVVDKGAFTKTIMEQGPASRRPRIKYLYQHDPFSILGVPQVLQEDDFGLYFESKIVPTTLGKDALLLYEAGVISEHSIGYETVKAARNKETGNLHLKELILYEGSAVTWGMNPDTPTLGVKSVGEVGLVAQMERVDGLLRKGNMQNEDLCEALSLQLKLWRATLKKQAQEPKREVIVVGDTQKARDFNTIVAQKQVEEDLYDSYWEIRDALHRSTYEIVSDAAITDKAAAIGASVDQFKSALTGWAVRAAAAGFWQDQAKADANLELLETKGLERQAKAGRVLSASNRSKVESAITALQAILDAVDKDKDDDDDDEKGGADSLIQEFKDLSTVLTK